MGIESYLNDENIEIAARLSNQFGTYAQVFYRDVTDQNVDWHGISLAALDDLQIFNSAEYMHLVLGLRAKKKD